jgi:putative acetyltransferase
MQAIEQLYPASFPDEDLLPLVRELLAESCPSRSLVAELDGTLVGHIAFTSCGVTGSDEDVTLLAPLAVAPHCHKQGIGTALMREGLALEEQAGAAIACVLGDPAYYGRIGFTAERNIAPPFPLPPEWEGAWQSLRLSDGVPIIGQLQVPDVWNRKSLWSPD